MSDDALSEPSAASASRLLDIGGRLLSSVVDRVYSPRSGQQQQQQAGDLLVEFTRVQREMYVASKVAEYLRTLWSIF